ncbi:hypothetical protein [Candidatus Steffania adelgidicola]|nr:hypothetical protein [Candidatus Steffania adelgidicola]
MTEITEKPHWGISHDHLHDFKHRFGYYNRTNTEEALWYLSVMQLNQS